MILSFLLSGSFIQQQLLYRSYEINTVTSLSGEKLSRGQLKLRGFTKGERKDAFFALIGHFSVETQGSFKKGL